MPALRDIAWLRTSTDRARYRSALVTAPIAVVAATAAALAGVPVALLLVPLATVIAAGLYMHLLAADRLQVLRHNSADMHWLHYKAVLWLHLGGPLRRQR